MKYSAVIGLLGIILCCAGSPQSTNPELQDNVDDKLQLQQLSNGLLIENGINRGMRYADSLGLTYIKLTITNENTVPANLHIALSKEYLHPHPDSDDWFKVILMPLEWAGNEITDSMIEELPNHLDKSELIEDIEPGETFNFVIGTLRPSPPQVCGIIPNLLFKNNGENSFPNCEWKTDQDQLSVDAIALGLKLDYCHTAGVAKSCSVISCGQITFTE